MLQVCHLCAALRHFTPRPPPGFCQAAGAMAGRGTSTSGAGGQAVPAAGPPLTDTSLTPPFLVEHPGPLCHQLQCVCQTGYVDASRTGVRGQGGACGSKSKDGGQLWRVPELGRVGMLRQRQGGVYCLCHQCV